MDVVTKTRLETFLEMTRLIKFSLFQSPGEKRWIK
ncbi:hypothetical protein LINPERPRIM_LOCUS24186 [Linum perenne]